MLVLTRKQGEGITIGNDISLTVLEIKQKHVRIGIEAPANYLIYRQEVYNKILTENKLAANPDLDKVKEIVKEFSSLKKSIRDKS